MLLKTTKNKFVMKKVEAQVLLQFVCRYSILLLDHQLQFVMKKVEAQILLQFI